MAFAVAALVCDHKGIGVGVLRQPIDPLEDVLETHLLKSPLTLTSDAERSV
jgi:hypothetical protein